MPTRLFRPACLLILSAIALFLPVATRAQPDIAEQPNVEEAKPVTLDDTVGWLVLDGPLREGPVREAWISEDEAAPSLRTVLDQINYVAEHEHYLGLVV